jgi:hypothetical protein
MAIPLHAPHGTPKKVVTFFTGWYKSDVADHGRQLRNQLIDALGSEVALVLSHFDKDECASRRAACVRARFRGLEPISFISSERQLSIAELTLMLEALPIWPKVIGKLNRAHVLATKMDSHRYASSRAFATRHGARLRRHLTFRHTDAGG